MAKRHGCSGHRRAALRGRGAARRLPGWGRGPCLEPLSPGQPAGTAGLRQSALVRSLQGLRWLLPHSLRAGMRLRGVPSQHEAGGGAALRADHADAGQGAGKAQGAAGSMTACRRSGSHTGSASASLHSVPSLSSPAEYHQAHLSWERSPTPPPPTPLQGIEVLNQAVEVCRASIEAAKGRMVVKEAARAVSEKEERALEEELQVGRAALHWCCGGDGRLYAWYHGVARRAARLCMGQQGAGPDLLPGHCSRACRRPRRPTARCLATPTRTRSLRRAWMWTWMRAPRWPCRRGGPWPAEHRS